MFKCLPAILIITSLLSTLTENPSLAETCASQCGSPPIQFVPGQHIRIQIVNSTPRLVNLEKPDSTGLISLQPGQKLQLEQANSTNPISLIFWNQLGTPLQAIVSKPNFGTLRVELRPSWHSPGDRSIFLREDGRVNVM
jgi:hypothetical protein